MGFVRLRQYAVLGARGGVLRPTSSQVTLPWGDLPTGQFSCSEAASGQLGDMVEFALEVQSAGQWVEARSARMVAVRSDADQRDQARVASYQARNLVLWLLSKLQIDPGEGELVDGARRFNSATPGAILKTLIDEGHARGWGPGVSYDFTASTDSAGHAWADSLSLGFRPGQVTGWQVLQNLYDQGVVDFWTEGRKLRVFNTDAGADLSTGNTPVRLGALTQLPVRASMDSLITDATLYGDDGFRLDLHNPAALTTFGRLEAAIAQGGVSDEGTATTLAQRTLDMGSQLRREISATANLTTGPFPLVDYQVGDTVQVKTTVWEPVKVHELVISMADTVTVSTVLNDRYVDLVERLAKRTNGIIGGAVTGGTGGMPGDDNRRPKAPVGLVASSTGFWADMLAQSQVSLAWSPVTEGENSVAIDVDLYEVWAAQGDGILQAVTSSQTEAASCSPFTPESSWRFAVRARSNNGVWGDLSGEVVVSMATPVGQLLAPSAPIVSTEHGVIAVTWDGLFSDSTNAPVSFMQMDIETSLNTMDGFTRAAVLWQPAETRLINARDGDALYVRFVAVDVLGRRSDPSPATLVNVADFIPDGYITAAMLDAGIGGVLDISANAAVTIIAGQAADAQTTATGAQRSVADMQTYYKFGPTGAVISTPGSPYSLRLTNDRIEMLEGSTVLGYWQGGRFVASNIVAAVAQIGNHVISGEIPGHTTWRPV